jgi:hypothetical protein
MAMVLLAGTGAFCDQLLAACGDGAIQIYEVEQCPYHAWFEAPPAGSGTVSAAWWQVGFGNLNVNVGGINNGSGWRGSPAPAIFMGNDSGLNTGDPNLLDIGSAVPFGGPAGSLCVGVSGSANWARPGIDGCADNVRTGLGPKGYSKDDNHLNTYYYSALTLAGGYLGTYTLAYQTDAPMAVLLTESTGKWYALAMFASTPRPGKENDAAPGNFSMGAISNGVLNTATGQRNIIPWRRVPLGTPGDPNTGTVTATFADPNNPTTSPRILAMTWTGPTAASVISDGSTRPTADTTMPVSGVGVMDQGPLVRYAVETAPIQAGPPIACGAFATVIPVDPNAGTSTTVTVNPDTCVRLRTIVGRTPFTSTASLANASSGRLGDLQTSTVTNPILVGGSLVSARVVIDSATKKGGEIFVTFHTGAELGTPTYSVRGVGANGKEITLASVPCSACDSGLGGSYTVTVSGKGGVKSIYIVSSTGDKSNTVQVK